MTNKKVKDLMIPVDEYPSVSSKSTMKEAIRALKKANDERGNSAFLHRAVLVVDKKNRIVGKIGMLSFLKAIEPKYKQFFDMDKLTHASGQLIESLKDNFKLWDGEISDLCSIALNTKVTDIMKPVEEHIDENEDLTAAVHKIIMWETLSLLVTRGNEIVGILRLSDIYREIETNILEKCNK